MSQVAVAEAEAAEAAVAVVAVVLWVGKRSAICRPAFEPIVDREAIHGPGFYHHLIEQFELFAAFAAAAVASRERPKQP